MIRIALAGNPNSGKTTMFNDLTGSSQYVGNWPGVTVEKKEGRLRGRKDVVVMDLPGVYSLSPYTLEEVISRNYLIDERPDAIINIVDASNIERNLYLTTQLMELGVPVVVALNMMDVVRGRGDVIDTAALSRSLGCPVTLTTAVRGEGTRQAASLAVELAGKEPPRPMAFGANMENTLKRIADLLGQQAGGGLNRFYAVKAFERDEKVMDRLKLDAGRAKALEDIIAAAESALDDDSESIVTGERYAAIGSVVKACVRKKNRGGLTPSDKVDRIVTNRFLALPIFAGVMFLVYYISVTTVGSWATDWVNDSLFGSIIPPAVEGWLMAAGSPDWLISLILDGIIGGVGAVLGFLPQMLVLFLLLAILEDCGYMARIAFIMDRIFRRFGLSGKSFIPMLIGTGCSVPGIMASRTIENEPDRKMTIITTSFIPCGAKLPIIALFAGALFGGSSWVAVSAFFIGIAAVIVSGIILKKTRGFAGDPAPFVMELPAYHVPGAKGVLIHMWDRGKSFVKKAGTIIFLACGLVWFLSSFNGRMQMVDAGESMLAAVGNVLAPVFRPLGWGEWRASVATITGLIAKENVVGTFGILYGFAEVAEDGAEIWSNLQAAFTPLAAYSFMIFNLLCAPCFAAIGAIRREMGNARWTFFAIGYQTVLAYAVSLMVYQLGMLFSGHFGASTVAAFAVLIVFLYLLLRPASREKAALTAGKSRAAA